MADSDYNGDLYDPDLDDFDPDDPTLDLGVPVPDSHRPFRRPKAKKPKVQLRDLGHRGVKETTHTSFRLDPADRNLLRKLAAKQRHDTGMDNLTMSSVLRRLIRDAAKEAGIQEQEEEVG